MVLLILIACLFLETWNTFIFGCYLSPESYSSKRAVIRVISSFVIEVRLFQSLEIELDLRQTFLFYPVKSASVK